MLPQDHPIWRIINVAVVLAGAALIMWINAANFDETEFRSLIELVMMLAGYESFKQFHAIPSSQNTQDTPI